VAPASRDGDRLAVRQPRLRDHSTHLSAEISAALDQPLTWDVHGETSLSEEDVEFIRVKAHEHSDGKPDTGYTFFDSVQP